jgi:hypothetical protein
LIDQMSDYKLALFSSAADLRMPTIATLLKRQKAEERRKSTRNLLYSHRLHCDVVSPAPVHVQCQAFSSPLALALASAVMLQVTG